MLFTNWDWAQSLWPTYRFCCGLHRQRKKLNKLAIGENCGEGLNTNHIVCWRFKAELLHGRRIHQILLGKTVVVGSSFTSVPVVPIQPTSSIRNSMPRARAEEAKSAEHFLQAHTLPFTT